MRVIIYKIRVLEYRSIVKNKYRVERFCIIVRFLKVKLDKYLFLIKY